MVKHAELIPGILHGAVTCLVSWVNVIQDHQRKSTATHFRSFVWMLETKKINYMAERVCEEYGRTQGKHICKNQVFCLFNLTDIMSQGISQYMSWIFPWDSIWLVTVWQVDEKKPFSSYSRMPFQCMNDISFQEMWPFFFMVKIHLLSAGKLFIPMAIKNYFTGLLVCLAV